MQPRLGLPNLGLGVGLRTVHFPYLLQYWPAIDWFEVISENFLIAGGRPLDNLRRLAAKYRVIPHGVSLAIGSVEPLDTAYLAKLKTLLAELDPPWFSDHPVSYTHLTLPTN